MKHFLVRVTLTAALLALLIAGAAYSTRADITDRVTRLAEQGAGALAQAFPDLIQKAPAASWPTDPTADIPWTPDGEYDGVADIQNAFNYARAQENAQLGLSLPALAFPSQSEWDALTNSQKALWILNQERVARGMAPLSGVESNVTSVAQNYADFLLANNAFSHYADGHDPDWRLDQNPAIGACRDFLGFAENLWALAQSPASTIPLPVERAVYLWLYDDSDKSWIHRHAALVYPYTDNSGPAGEEGFLGIGVAAGGPYQGYDQGTIVVMNFFDPCSSWVYPTTYTISGDVATSTGSGVAGVTIDAGAGGSVATDSGGFYTLSGLAAGSYTLIPSKTGYTFSPSLRQVSITTGDVSNQNFTAIPVSTASHRCMLPSILSGVGQLIGATPGYWENPTTQAQWFYVDPSGTTVTNFTVLISVEGCGTYTIKHNPDEPITNGQFSFTGPFYASGAFYSPTTISGVYGFDNFEIADCGKITSNGDRAWEAAWVDSSQP